MAVTLDPGIGSNVPQAQRVTNTGIPANYAGNANKPWTTPGRAQYIGLPIVTKAVTAADQWSTASYFQAHRNGSGVAGVISVSISGTFTATITLQKSYDNGSTWIDVKTWTAAAEEQFDNPSAYVKWRIGVKAAQYTSGTANLRLSQA